jgi:hypothetical protein
MPVGMMKKLELLPLALCLFFVAFAFTSIVLPH